MVIYLIVYLILIYGWETSQSSSSDSMGLNFWCRNVLLTTNKLLCLFLSLVTLNIYVRFDSHAVGSSQSWLILRFWKSIGDLPEVTGASNG